MMEEDRIKELEFSCAESAETIKSLEALLKEACAVIEEMNDCMTCEDGRKCNLRAEHFLKEATSEVRGE